MVNLAELSYVIKYSKQVLKFILSKEYKITVDLEGDIDNPFNKSDGEGELE